MKDFRNYFPAGVSTNKVAVDSKGYGWTVFDNKLIRISDTDSLEVPLSKFNIDQWICRSLFVDSQDRLWVGMAYRKDILVLQLDYTSKVIERESEKVLVYPNPAFDRLYVDSDSAIKKIEVYDMQGKIILYAINESAVDIKSLKAGIYIVEVLTQNSKTVRKIVIE
ncbi:MAG: T9SS type A sorting domain-containing protein [Saprospiraceae bacterium]|nr:T9SS type A sorting domain-containing protein [Saprospiraceae bacterium]